MIALAVALVLCTLIAAAAVPLWRSPLLLKRRLLKRVVVTMKSGQSFEGLLYEADRHAWFLRDASALGVADKGSNLPVDGEVVLLADEIAYAQRP